MNGISDGAVLRAASIEPSWILSSIAAASAFADAVVAYNAPFDRAVLERMANQLRDGRAAWHAEDDEKHVRFLVEGRPWVCAHADVRFPSQGSGRKLGYLAHDHGIQVVDGHRAAGDVRTLTELLLRCPDLDEQIADAQRPRRWYAAVVSYENRGDAKAAGFSWDPLARLWTRHMTAVQCARVLSEHPQLVVDTCEQDVRHTPQGEVTATLRRANVLARLSDA